MFNLFNKDKAKFTYEAVDVSKLEQADVAKAFARTFNSRDGKVVLGYLQALTFQRALTATTPDEQLRFYEGQRGLVATILRLIERGRKG